MEQELTPKKVYPCRSMEHLIERNEVKNVTTDNNIIVDDDRTNKLTNETVIIKPNKLHQKVIENNNQIYDQKDAMIIASSTYAKALRDVLMSKKHDTNKKIVPGILINVRNNLFNLIIFIHVILLI